MYLFLSFYVLLLTHVCKSSSNISERGACENNGEYCRCPSDDFLSCIGFPTFNVLNFVSATSPAPLVDFFQLQPAVALKLDASLNLAGIRLAAQSRVVLTNLNSIEFTADPFEPVKEPTAIRLRSLNLDDTILSFSFSNTPLDATTCSFNSIGATRKSIFAQFDAIYLASSVQFVPLCPFLFSGANLQLIELNNITEANRFQFIPTNIADEAFLRANVIIRKLEIYSSRISSLDEKVLSKSVFGQMQDLLIANTSLEEIDENLFKTDSFPMLRSIRLQLRGGFNSIFKNGSTGWIAALNDNSGPQQQLLLLSLVDNNFPPYTYPDSDLCLFAYFPHERQVFAEIKSDTHIYACTCTLIWLLKNWQNYTLFNLSNQAVASCLEPGRFQALLASCELDYRIDICRYPPTSPEPTTSTTEELETTEDTPLPPPEDPLLYIIIGCVVGLILISSLAIAAILIYRCIINNNTNRVIHRPETPSQNTLPLQTNYNYCSQIQHRIYLNQNHFRIYDNKVGKNYRQELEADVLALVRLNRVKKLGNNSEANKWLNTIYYIDDTNRLVLDFRKLNSCIADKPDIDGKLDKIDVIKRLSVFNCFTVLDLNEKFASQIYLDPQSRIHTSFRTPSGTTCCYNTIPFGLKNGHLTARKTCDLILSKALLNIFSIRIGDRLILFASDEAENENNRDQLNERFLEHNINMNELNELQNNDTQIEIFDSVIGNSKVIPNPRKVTSIEGLMCCETNDQLKLFHQFFACFSDKLPDYYVLNSQQERLGKLLLTENQTAQPDVLTKNTYNDFLKCFEQIKTKISSMIDKKEFTPNGVFNLCVFYTSIGRAMLLSNDYKIVALRYERNFEEQQIDKPANVEKLKEKYTEILLWALNELETNDISVDDRIATTSDDSKKTVKNSPRPDTAMKTKQPTILAIKPAAKLTTVSETSEATEAVEQTTGRKYVVHSKFPLLVNDYFHDFQNAKLVKNLCLLQNYQIRFAMEKPQQFHSMLVRSYCRLLDSYTSLN